MAKIKKGDTVLVIAGKDKGAQGQGHRGLPEQDKVLVEGVNRVKKHTRVGQTQRGAKTGGIVTPGGPDPRLQRAAVDSDGKKATRVGYRIGRGRPQRGSPSAPVRTSDT